MKTEKFNDLYRNYSERIYNYALWLTRNRDACNDILQVVFIRLWSNIATFLHSEDGLEYWLYRVTRNACLDHFRTCSRFTRVRLKYAREAHLSTQVNHEEKLVWNKLDKLNEKERSILYLRFHTGHTLKEVAEILKMNSGQVRVIACRALKKIRKHCAKDLP